MATEIDPRLLTIISRAYKNVGRLPKFADAKRCGWVRSESLFFKLREIWRNGRDIPTVTTRKTSRRVVNKYVPPVYDQGYKPVDIEAEAQAAKRPAKLAPEISKANGRPINDPAAQLTPSQLAIGNYLAAWKRIRTEART